jgi:hypothetical protein
VALAALAEFGLPARHGPAETAFGAGLAAVAITEDRCARKAAENCLALSSKGAVEKSRNTPASKISSRNITSIERAFLIAGPLGGD